MYRTVTNEEEFTVPHDCPEIQSCVSVVIALTRWVIEDQSLISQYAIDARLGLSLGSSY